MEEKIKKELQQIEKEYSIKILYSCESGSRAWGFPSPVSDYDVRFIYTRALNDYLTVCPEKDQLSFPINDEIDLYGWDISKVLRLIVKSNTTPFEWLQSPVIYRENKEFKEKLWQLSQSYFCQRSNIHHYLGVARGAMDTIEGEEIRIKKLFYVLRPLLAALWCAERKTIAPMNIHPLMGLFSDNLRKKVLSLIELKTSVVEGYAVKIDEHLKEWIDQTTCYCLEVSQKIDRKTFDTKKADLFFRKIIQK